MRRVPPLLTGLLALGLLPWLSGSGSSRADSWGVLPLAAVTDSPLAAVGLRLPSHHATGATGADAAAACDKDIDTGSSIRGVTFVAAQDNVICTTGEIDSYESDGDLYVVQAGGQEAAFTITRIAPDGAPTMVTQKTWTQANTYAADVKAFGQGTNRYIALALERLAVGAACGVVIVDVTAAPTTSVVDQVIGADWCDVHNVFVEDDAAGQGRYLYLTADAPNDMRVLDISDLGNISEIGRYTHLEASNSNYVHDMAAIDHGGVIGRRVYVSYWDAGLMILDADDVTPGVIEPGSPSQPLNPNHSIDPASFRTHDAYPSADGSRAFIEDEFLNTPGAEPVQMWDITSPASPSYVDGIPLGSALMPVVNPAHNLLVVANRLYVGWYKGGLQAFDFDAGGFLGRPVYHRVQTEAADDEWDGAWNALLKTIGPTTYVFQSDRRYGLIVDGLVPDSDGDGFIDTEDNCISLPNDQANGDSDTWGDACDNCPGVGNQGQENFDGDAQGDACDDDDDNDGILDAADPDDDNDEVYDVDEGPCGGLTPSSRRPERLDLLGDDDGDTLVDEALPSPASDAFDCDGDGWTGAQEALVFGTGGTVSDQDSCGNNGWPADLDPNNVLNIGDLNSFIFPNGPDDGHGVFAYFGHPVPDAGRVDEERWDLSPNGVIEIGDINALNPAVTAATARPPMFNGQQAFFAGACPWPP